MYICKLYIYMYMVKGSFWACVFAYVSTRVSHCTRLPFSLQCTMRIRDRIQYWTGTAEPSCAARTEDIPSPLPLRIQVLRENDLRAATNFGSSATSPAKVNKGGQGNVLVIGLPGEGHPWNPTSSSKFLVRVRSNTTAGGKDFMVFRRASENLHSL